MRRLFILSLILFTLLVFGLLTRRGEWLAFALPYAVYLAGSLLRRPGVVRLEITRNLSNELTDPDKPVQVSLTVTNRGVALEEVLLNDLVPEGLTVHSGIPCRLVRLKAGQIQHWDYTVQGKRGSYAFQTVSINAREPLGLTGVKMTLPVPGHILIVPPIIPLKNIAIRPRRTRVYSGTIPASVGGSGVDFYGVREYQEGDPPHWINWRASARQPTALFSNEFEQERVADIGIVLDGRQRVNLFPGKHSLFEHSVLAAATLAEAFLNQGNRVGMLLYARYLHWTLPGYGKLQRERILQALGQAQPGESQIFADLDHIPTRLFPAQSQIVLVSPLVSDDVDMLVKLRARGHPVILISPDPVAFEAEILPQTLSTRQARRVVQMERELMLQRLRHTGIQVVNWQVTQRLDIALQSALGRPPTWLRAIEGLA